MPWLIEHWPLIILVVGIIIFASYQFSKAGRTGTIAAEPSHRNLDEEYGATIESYGLSSLRCKTVNGQEVWSLVDTVTGALLGTYGQRPAVAEIDFALSLGSGGFAEIFGES